MDTQQILNNVFGYNTFRTGQEEIINTILNKKNILILAADGYPKAFLESNSYKLIFENAEIDGEQIHANVLIKKKR